MRLDSDYSIPSISAELTIDGIAVSGTLVEVLKEYEKLDAEGRSRAMIMMSKRVAMPSEFRGSAKRLNLFDGEATKLLPYLYPER